MAIIFEKESNTKIYEYDCVKYGEIFKYGDDLYLKVKNEEGHWCYLTLNSSLKVTEGLGYCAGVEILPVDVKITIIPKGE